MKVLLVNPPPLDRVPARIVTPPLGVLYLAASLKARGIEARVIDAEALGLGLERVVFEARQMKPDLIGVTGMSPTVTASYQALSALRPEAGRLALGGAHASAQGQSVFEDCPVELDFAVCGESEEIFPKLVSRLAGGAELHELDLPGVLVRGGSSAPPWPVVKDLDSLPFPDLSQVPHSRYRHPLFGSEPVTSIITSRGCPYRCIFCDKHVSGSRYRSRSPENVLAEIEQIVFKSGVRSLIIYDDLFTLDPDRVSRICEGILGRGLRIRWKCEGRVNRVDPDLLGLMKAAGCQMIAYGVETVTPRGLEFLRKDITPEQVREAFALTREAGIQSLGYFMLGIPGETIEEERETVRFAVSLGADFAQFGVLSPFPGTELYELAREKGWLSEAPARGPAERGSRRPVILDGYWTLDKLDRMVREAHRRFYFRAGYLARRLLRVRSAGEFAAMLGQGIRLGWWWLRSAVKRR